MLSTGTRIGPHRVEAWLREGGTGQSYKVTGTEGENKNEVAYLKLLPREITETQGFEEIFSQECQALQQIDGPGIWPLRKFGVMKWKHWVSYDWFEGTRINLSELHSHGLNPGDSDQEIYVFSLQDDLAINALPWTQKMLLEFMIVLHQGLHRAHGLGFAHGNLKPSNILIKRSEAGQTKAWITEFGLHRILAMGENKMDVDSPRSLGMSTEAQESMDQSELFRSPKNVGESGDLFALGEIASRILSDSLHEKEFAGWKSWVQKAKLEGGFPSLVHSVEALPGIGDISKFGFSPSKETPKDISSEEIREKREREWALKQKTANLKFRRNITGLIGSIFLTGYLLKVIYLMLFPAAWTEYSLPGALDSYQLGAGLWSGQSWGILPAMYDDGGKGGRDIVGKWEKEDGIFRLDFKKFRKPEDAGEKKKLWQFIGKGATSEADYHHWSDYLEYDRSGDRLFLIKRVDEFATYKPGFEEGKSVRLYPLDRFEDSRSKVSPAQLAFIREGKSLFSFELFIGIGFIVASFLYRRSLSALEETGEIDS